MTISLSDNNPRISYTVGQGVTQTTFTVPFEFFDLADLNVYVDGTQKTATTHYTVASGGSGATGTINLSVTGASGGSTVVITRDIDLARTTDFPTSGSFNIGSLNTELDKITAQFADRKDAVDRSLRLQDSDAAASMELPLKDARKGTVLGFNASTGVPEAGPTIADVSSLSAITADISSLADIEDGTTATDAISGVAAIASNVTTVAGISSNVTSLAGAITNINLLAPSDVRADMALLGTADVIADMALLANTDVIADMNTLATSDIVSDLNTLATSDIVSDLNTLATADIVSDINTLATSDIVSDLNTLATSDIVSDINTLATSDIVSDLNTLATSDFVSDLNAVEAIASNVTTVANNSSNINTVASNIGTISAKASLSGATFTGNITFSGSQTVDGRDVSADGTKLDGIASSATANPNAINNVVEDTSPQLGADLQSNGHDIDFADNDKAVFGDGSDLQIYHDGSSSRVVNATGNLKLQADIFEILNQSGTEQYLNAVYNGAVNLFHNNSAKLATTATGIDVTGTAVTDGLTVAGNISTTGTATFTKGSTGTLATFTDGVATNFTFKTDGSNVGTFGTEAGSTHLAFMSSGTERMRLTSGGFVGIGDTAPNVLLSVKGADAEVAIDDSNSAPTIRFRDNGSTRALLEVDASNNINFDTGPDGSVAEKMRIDSTGRVSIHPDGTAFFGESSADNFNIYQTGANVGMTLRSDNDRAIGIYFADGASGGDLYRGYIQYNHANELFDFAGQGAVRLIAGGNERLRILSDGRICKGRTSAISGEDISHEYNSNNGSGLLMHSTDTSGNNHSQITFRRNGSNVGSISTTGSATSFDTSSDRRLKSNIEDAESASSKIDAIQVRQFDWNADNSHQEYGLIAQELEPIAPLAVTDNADSDEMMGVDYSKLVPMLIKEIQELRGRVAALEAS